MKMFTHKVKVTCSCGCDLHFYLSIEDPNDPSDGELMADMNHAEMVRSIQAIEEQFNRTNLVH